MSIWGYRVSVKLIAMTVAVVLLGALAAALARPAPREIRLVARGMAFYLENGDQPNPTLTFTAGDRVRVVFTNQCRRRRAPMNTGAGRT